MADDPDADLFGRTYEDNMGRRFVILGPHPTNPKLLKSQRVGGSDMEQPVRSAVRDFLVS